MSRTLYASLTLAREIERVFGDTLVAEPAGTPDGWGSVKALRVTGEASSRTALVDVLAGVVDRRLDKVVETGDAVIIQLKPRSDDPSPFGLRSHLGRADANGTE